ncbi:50S ribosomal protein L17 [Humidisolicoccus flavus]|uniref:50S ribosomal protein L17 n=1 Tax=Humidisolicoccus flavus TaxID=3111414 RepID=UPI003246E9D0
MPKPTKGARLGGGPAHERLLLANLAKSLIIHKSIKTTETKAKRLRPIVERLVTFAKRGDLHARRRVISIIGKTKMPDNEWHDVVGELFEVIAPQVAEREGGYTRITKLGFRKGDNASMVQIEFVLEPVVKKAKKSKADAAPVADEAPEAEVVADDAEATESDATETEATEAAADESNSSDAAAEEEVKEDSK